MEQNTLVNFSTTNAPTTENPEGTTGDLVIRTTFLAIILLFGFLINLILVVTIVSSASLRTVSFHCHLVNLSVTHLVTCLIILPIVIGYAATGTWDYGESMCNALAHIIMTGTIATCLSVLVMNFDRVVAIHNPEKYLQRLNMCRTVTLILIVWIIAVLFPLPLSLGTVPVTNFDDRYMCSIGKGSSMDYLISLYSICFAFPSIAGVLCFIYIAREALSEREAQSVGVRQPSLSQLWPEAQCAGIVFVIFLCWFVTELPFVTLTSIHQYTYSDVMEGEETSFSPPPLLETSFVWLKFCDTFLAPLAAFKLRKEVWLKFKDMLRRKNNSVNDSSPRQEKTEPKRKPNSNSNNQPQPNKTSYNPKSAARFKVPTIRATREGLHIQGDAESDDSIFYADMDLTGKSAGLNLPHAQLTQADIENLPDLESYEMSTRANHAQNVDEDTSDYETDPYSHSDPISVRSSHGSRATHSYSRNEDSPNFRVKANSVSHDSGNGSASSSVKKKKKKRKTAEKAVEGEDNPVDSHRSHTDSVSNQNVAPQSYYMVTNIDEDLYVEPKSESESRKGRKYIETTSSQEVLTTPVDETSEAQPVKRKKKKKRNQDIVDAETNTTHVSVLEMIERKIPPPRLDPLPQNITSAMSTPPLRSKYPREVTDLPPTGDSSSKRKHRVSRTSELPAPTEEEHPISGSEAPTDSQRRKKKSRPRKKSGDSNKPLMSSNTSSEMHSVVNESKPYESHQ